MTTSSQPTNQTFQYKDFFGRDIKVGDLIMYALSSQHYAHLKFGKVLALGVKSTPYTTPQAKVTVQAVERDHKGDPRKVCMKSTIFNLEKICVLPVQIPQTFMDLL